MISGAARPFDRQCPGFIGFIRQRGIVHDDEFIQRGERLFANGRVTENQQAIFQGHDDQFGENVPLQDSAANRSRPARCKITDIARKDGIEIAERSGPVSENTERIVRVDERDVFACDADIPGSDRQIARGDQRRNMARAWSRRRDEFLLKAWFPSSAFRVYADNAFEESV